MLDIAAIINIMESIMNIMFVIAVQRKSLLDVHVDRFDQWELSHGPGGQMELGAGLHKDLGLLVACFLWEEPSVVAPTVATALLMVLLTL